MKITRITTILFTILLLLTCHCRVTAFEDAEPYLTITYLDVGQGDAALISTADGYHMLIDGGGDDKAQFIYSYLTEHGITELSYIVLSHAHRDHAGGLAAALRACRVHTALSPVDSVVYEAFTFDDFVAALKAQGAFLLFPKPGTTFRLGNALCTVIGPITTEGLTTAEQANDTSLVIRIDYGNTSFLFTGDAEFFEESQILASGMDIDCDVLKVSHHGSYTATTDRFLAEASPQAAIISCGSFNEYGHPHQQTLDRLAAAGVQVYRTDTMGTVTVRSDGTSIFFSTEQPSADFSVMKAQDMPLIVPDEWPGGEQAEAAVTYVLNTSPNSMKFHYPYCPSVNDMSPKNRQEFSGSREEAISLGYTPCGYCKP